MNPAFNRESIRDAHGAADLKVRSLVLAQVAELVDALV